MASKRIAKKPSVPKEEGPILPERVVKKTRTEKPKGEKVQKKYTETTLTGAKVPWYLKTGKDAANLLIDHVTHLRTVPLASYRRDVIENIRLYTGHLNVNGTKSSLGGKMLRYNLGKSVVDTGASIMCAARTLPFCQTRGADWKLRRKCLLRNQTIQSQWQDIGVFDQADRAILDALITRLGAVKFFEDPDRDGGTAGCERVLPLSLVWDPAEAAAGSVRSIYEVRLINRDVLIELFPEFKHEIALSPGPSHLDVQDFQLEFNGNPNQCVVIEGWHLPSGSDSQDGRHVIAIQNAELHGEPWKTPRFPFGFLPGWETGLLGFTGVSLIDVCKAPQLRIEQLHDHIQRCQTLGSNPRVFLKKGSMVEPEQVTNAPMQAHIWDGDTPPIFFQFDATPHDFEKTVQDIREQTLSMLGMSVQQISGDKPAGVTSAVGQRAAEDISSKRHIRPLRHLEAFYLQCSQALVDVNDRIAEDRSDFSIDRGARNAWLEGTKWRDLMLDEKDQKMAVLPVSQLVGSVAAQFDTVSEWVAAGWCSQQVAKMLVAMPDTEGQAEEDTEDSLYSRYLIDDILDGKKVGVDPALDAMTFAGILRIEYLKAKRNKADESVLQEFRRVMAIVEERAKKATPAPAPVLPPGSDGLAIPGAMGPPAPPSQLAPGGNGIVPGP